MTSFAFVLGVVPLVMAQGAGAASRQSLGTAVFGGMLGATFLGLLFTPALYVVIQAVTEWLGFGHAHKRPNTPIAEPEDQKVIETADIAR